MNLIINNPILDRHKIHTAYYKDLYKRIRLIDVKQKSHLILKSPCYVNMEISILEPINFNSLFKKSIFEDIFIFSEYCLLLFAKPINNIDEIIDKSNICYLYKDMYVLPYKSHMMITSIQL